jgi:hypothetical protein
VNKPLSLTLEFEHPGEACIVLAAVRDAYRAALKIMVEESESLTIRGHAIARIDQLSQFLREAQFLLRQDELQSLGICPPSFPPGRQ